MAAGEEELLRLWTEMAEGAREQLLEFARFLRQRHPAPAPEPAEPVDIPAAPGESVVAAIKRLSATYPMLDRARLLDETSTLVAQHAIQGRAREEVIEALEAVFLRHYEAWRGDRRGGAG